jgi:alkylhydroperoxidase/carboxymuconolactone decarboxylase family protein YurZ
VTIAILAALGREELGMHLRAIRNTGASPEEVAEVLLHVAVYAGIPAAHAAYERARSILYGDGDGDGDGDERPAPEDDGDGR